MRERFRENRRSYNDLPPNLGYLDMTSGSLSEDRWDDIVTATYVYWQSISPEGILPGRQHLDPSDIPRLLPHLWLMDVQQAPRAYRWRLIGSEAQAGKLPVQPGGSVDNHLEGKTLKKALAVLDQVVDTRQPNWAKGRPLMPHDPAVRSVERLILPLARNGVTVDMLLGVTVYEWDSSRRLPHPLHYSLSLALPQPLNRGR